MHNFTWKIASLEQCGRYVNLRTPRCHRKEWRPLARSKANSCYNSDLANEATKTISFSVHWVFVQKTSGKLVDLVCCQDLCAKRERSVQLLVRSRCWGSPCASFHQKKFLVHQRVLKKSGLPQTESDETTPFSWSVRFCFWIPVAWRLGEQRQQRKNSLLPPEPIAGAVGGWRFVGDVLLSWLPLAGWPSTSSAWASFLRASEFVWRWFAT